MTAPRAATPPLDDRPSRRDFLALTALTLGAAGTPALAGAAAGPRVFLVMEPDDEIAGTPQVTWAVKELRDTLAARRGSAVVVTSLGEADAGATCVVIADETRPSARRLLDKGGARAHGTPESLVFAHVTDEGRHVLVAAGHDRRGLMYAVLELADRVRYAELPRAAFDQPTPLAERPFNQLRAIGRPFVSDVEDKPWYYDRAFWPAYFAMLARERVNRFHLLFGMGFDTLRWVKDAYLLFAYPFLVHVPGYDVRAVGLPHEERDRNLETLRFISHEAVAHGIDFQLGLWTHGYVWADSADTNYTIAGISQANDAAYCRDALAAVLRACPDVTGVTLRTHYESGVKEGSYAFWKTVFDGVVRSGRRLEIELHAKGLDQRMIDGALATGMPVRVSPKYWAEHTGLPYHQAAIRGLELPKDGAGLDAFSALSFGERQHTRYGHADFMREDRTYGVMYRVFPGTHKFLLWGDPVTAAAHARAFAFCGAEGAELFEPLSFKGRRGSGIAGGRCAYADASLTPERDWEKYRYTYRLWGRMLYDPDTPADVWRRMLRADYGTTAPEVEDALGRATRILPIVTTAHLPSAAQDTYSPEFYTNQSTVDPAAPSPYGDTPVPKDALHVSPLDPAMFATIDEFVSGLVAGTPGAKYSPIDAARWIEQLAGDASRALDRAVARRTRSGAIQRQLQRTIVDVRAQVGMGAFFAAKLRSAALYSVFVKTGDRRALDAALAQYRAARDAWATFAGALAPVYVADITFGPLPHQRGHWVDRVPAMDADIAAMARATAPVTPTPDSAARAGAAIDAILHGRPRPALDCVHTPPAAFTAGAALPLSLAVRRAGPPPVVTLHYRHVNQAERYERRPMDARDGAFHATIPGAYTDSTYPMQYYFEVVQHAPAAAAQAWLHPGFNEALTNQPYYVVRRARG